MTSPCLYILARIISDTGLLVLIWIVQLVIYPSFRYYEPQNLKNWHDAYTKRITVVVMPLMLLQLCLSIYAFVSGMDDAMQIVDTLFVLLTWVTTFVIFVPLHGLITQQKQVTSSVKKLVYYNWIRTFLWSAIFALTIYGVLFSK